MQFINNLRGIAILLIILAHSAAGIDPGDSLVVISIAMLLDNSTILFVIIAGYLFIYITNNFRYLDYLKNKLTGVVIPYFFISLPAVSIYLTGLKHHHYFIDMDWFTQLDPVVQYLYLMATGAHLGPLWFIPMIVLLYIVSPVFIYLKNRNYLELTLLISLIAAVAIGRPEFNDNNLYSALYFLPAYLVGMMLMLYPGIYQELKKYSLVLLLSAISLYLLYMWSFRVTESINSSLDLLLKIALSIILFAFANQYLVTKNRCLDMFARLSFFLFFIHGYFTALFRVLDLNIMGIKITGLLALCICFSCVTLLSLAAFIVLKLILKKRSKLFIGI